MSSIYVFMALVRAGELINQLLSKDGHQPCEELWSSPSSEKHLSSQLHQILKFDLPES